MRMVTKGLLAAGCVGAWMLMGAIGSAEAQGGPGHQCPPRGGNTGTMGAAQGQMPTGPMGAQRMMKGRGTAMGQGTNGMRQQQAMQQGMMNGMGQQQGMQQGMMNGMGPGAGGMQHGMNAAAGQADMNQQPAKADDTRLDQNDPAAILAHKDELKLTEEQIKRLEKMQTAGKKRGAPLLNKDQKKKLAELAGMKSKKMPDEKKGREKTRPGIDFGSAAGS